MKPLAVLISLFVLTACTKTTPQQPTHQAKAMVANTASISCDASQAEWIEWRKQQVKNLMTPTLKGPNGEQKYFDTELSAQKALATYNVLAPCSKQDPEKFKPLANLEVFTKNLRRIALTNAQGEPDHLFGFSITDLDYINYARPNIKIPELLNSQEFLTAVSNPKSYKKAYDMIMQRNKGKPIAEQWVVLLYESQFLTTPDRTTYGRFFIYIPGEVQKWIQFGIVTPDMKQTVFCPKPHGTDADQTICSMSIVSVRDRGEGAFPKTEVYIVDYWREYHDDGKITMPTRVEAGHGTSNCSFCHKTPVLPIYPAREFTFDDQGNLIEKIQGVGDIPRWLNNLIPSYGPPYFGGLMEQAAYGPDLGPLIERSAEFMQACTAGYNVNPNKIASRMQCASCHNANLMGEINFPQANFSDNDLEILTLPDGTMHALVETYISEGLMPPSDHLTTEEQQALTNCLMTEYFDYKTGQGLLVDWLNNKNNASTSL